MPDYKHMTVHDMLKLARKDSCKTLAQIVEESQYGKSAISRFFSEGQREDGSEYLPNVAKLPVLMKVLGPCGSRHIFEWLKAQSQTADKVVPPAKNKLEVYDTHARLVECVGEIGRLLADSTERGIDPPCARDIISTCNDLVAHTSMLIAMLDEQASHRDINEIAPLASMKQQKGWFKKFTEYMRGKDNVG